MAQQVGAEGTRGTEPVDAERIVAPVLGRPFRVGNESGRERLERKVYHAVTADDHGGALALEGIKNARQCLGRGVEVVGVELHGKAAAARVADGEVPAAADAEVGARGHDDHHAAVACEAREHLARAVGGMVVHDNHVEIEVALLRQGAFHRIGDGAFAVADRNDDAARHGPFLRLTRQGIVEFVGSEPGPDGLQVVRDGPFHFELHVALGGIDVVELLLSRSAEVGFGLGVERFAQVNEVARLLAHEKAQGVDGGIFVAQSRARAEEGRKGGRGE